MTTKKGAKSLAVDILKKENLLPIKLIDYPPCLAISVLKKVGNSQTKKSPDESEPRDFIMSGDLRTNSDSETFIEAQRFPCRVYKYAEFGKEDSLDNYIGLYYCINWLRCIINENSVILNSVKEMIVSLIKPATNTFCKSCKVTILFSSPPDSKTITMLKGLRGQSRQWTIQASLNNHMLSDMMFFIASRVKRSERNIHNKFK